MAERTGWQRVAKRIRVPMGFGFAVVFLWLARPTSLTMLLSLPAVLTGLCLRGYAAGYVRKNAELTTTGPYGYTRNPLYLGSMLIAFGFGAASGSWLLVGGAHRAVSGDLFADDSGRRGVSASALYRVRAVCGTGAKASAEANGAGKLGRRRVLRDALSTTPRVQCSYGSRRDLPGAAAEVGDGEPRVLCPYGAWLNSWRCR